MLRMLVILCSVGFALTLASRAHAAGSTIHYPAGWNMVGGPIGTDFSAAQAVDVYTNGAYSASSSRLTAACTGYWAYFAVPTDVSLSQTTVTTESCMLARGWNMVGNPFNSQALLPPDTAASFWDPSSNSYVGVTHIPVGGSVWIYATEPRSVTLHSAPQGEVTVSAPPPPRDPIQLHVGEYLTVVVPASDAGALWDAHSDSTYLLPVGNGTSSGSPTFSYRWQAVAPGGTVVVVDPACLKNGCKAPSYGVPVTILP